MALDAVLCLVCLEPLRAAALGAHLVSAHPELAASAAGSSKRLPGSQRSPELLHAASMLASGNGEGAMAALESAVERDPTVQEGWFQKAMLHIVRAEFGESLICLERAIAIDEKDARVWVAKFFALERLGGRSAEAARCLIKAADIDPQFTQRWIAERFSEKELGEIRKRYGAGGR
jgi:tetratricopeptide (TPR) repeat protein